MKKAKLFFLNASLYTTLLLLSASEKHESSAIIQGPYPKEEPYLFVSTIHNPLSVPPADHLACVSREFNHGVLIGLFRFRSNQEWDVQVKDWSVKAEALLDAINTDRLYTAVRDRLKSSQEILPQAVRGALSGCAINCERTLFQEDYRQVNGNQEAFALQLALRRAQGCALAGRLIVGMRCLNEQCIVNCHLSTTETSFFESSGADVWYCKPGSLFQAESCEPQLLAEGFVVPEMWGEIMYNMLKTDVPITTRTFAQIAVVKQWMEPAVSNPTVIGVDVEKLRRAMLNNH